MQIVIRAGDELPIYRQIMGQITEAIALGRLRPGEKLPSHRDLAEELVIAPLTVKKAYDELELLGFIETQRGRGTFVCAKLPKVKAAERREQVDYAARKLLSLVHQSGLDLSDAVAVLTRLESELWEGAPSASGNDAGKESR